jgi:hypothetical protein
MIPHACRYATHPLAAVQMHTHTVMHMTDARLTCGYQNPATHNHVVVWNEPRSDCRVLILPE